MSDEDLVKGLRGQLLNCKCSAWSSNECCCDTSWPSDFCEKAADAIERLTRERDEARVECKQWEARAEKAWAMLDKEYTDSICSFSTWKNLLDAAEQKVEKLRAALSEAEPMLSWALTEGLDEAIPDTCPVEYDRACRAIPRARAALKETENKND